MIRQGYAIINSSQRLTEVEMHGSIFIVWSPGPAPYGYRKYHGPFRRHDKRFKLLPRDFYPEADNFVLRRSW